MAARVVSVSAAVVKSRPQTLAMGRKEPATARPRALRATPARPSTGTWDNAGCGKVIGDAPKNTSADIIARLNTVVNAAEPRIKTRLAGLGATTLPGSAADFEKMIAGETAKWIKVIRTAGMNPE